MSDSEERWFCIIVMVVFGLPMLLISGSALLYIIFDSIWSNYKRIVGGCHYCRKRVPLKTVDFGAGMSHYAIDLCESCRGEAP